MNPYKSIWDDIKSNECWSYCQKDYLCHLFYQKISIHNDAKYVSYLKLNFDHDHNDDGLNNSTIIVNFQFKF